MEIWQTGRFPTNMPSGAPWPDKRRQQLATSEIAGGHIGVLVAVTGDQDWIQTHFRFLQTWTRVDLCHRCLAQNRAGPHMFTQFCGFPERSHASYLTSPGAHLSPLSRLPGFHLSCIKEELMHLAPLGCMRDATASALREFCDTGEWGLDGLTPWEFRVGGQLSAAFAEFSEWAKDHFEQHSIKRFTTMAVRIIYYSTSFMPFQIVGIFSCSNLLCLFIITIELGNPNESFHV